MIDKTDSAARSDSPNSPATPIKSASPGNSPTAIIGPKIRIKGDLSGDEDILIQGRVDGTIELKENSLTIGENGSVKANAVAKTITIEGEVEGDLYGAENIVIRQSSNVRGNLVSPRVSLEDGAKFRGSIDMEADPKAIPNLSGRSSASTTSSDSSASKPAASAPAPANNSPANKSK
ncbi:MAG: polymer-forming cytoskeletal protein [Pseudomonadota bacterium]